MVEASAAKGIARRPIPADEIRVRALCAMVNEGARILAEGIALRPVDIDMVWLFGYGFPAYEGGPMFWADRRGLDRVLADIRGFADHDPRSWVPAPLLVELAEAARCCRRDGVRLHGRLQGGEFRRDDLDLAIRDGQGGICQ